MERSIKGDYIGFTFGDVHSSELGLVRVSDGSRYNTDLLPPLEDKVAQVAGRDGEVLFGTTYKAKEIKVPVAFDNMTEESFRRLTQLLADKKPKSLWFDESPYKEWIVKSANVQDFKWVCFDESHNGKEKRIYKGEGTLIFKCRSPYAQSRVTYLDDPVSYVYVKDGHKIIKKEKVAVYSIFSYNDNFKETKMQMIASNIYKNKNGIIYDFNSEKKISEAIKKELESKTPLLCFSAPLDNSSGVGIIGIKHSFNGTTSEFFIKQSNIYNIDINNCTKKNEQWIISDAENIFTKEKINLIITGIENSSRPLFFKGKIGDEDEEKIINLVYGNICLSPSVFIKANDLEELKNSTAPGRGAKYFTYIYYQGEKTPTLQDNYNFEEWKEVSGLVLKEGYENFNSIGSTMNSGDIEANFILTIKEFMPWAEIMDKEGEVHFLVGGDVGGETKKLILHKLEKIESECLQFDSKIKLIKGGTYDEENKKFLPDGKIYNFLIKKGDFFRLNVGKTRFTSMPVALGQTELLNFEHKHYYYT